MFIRAQGLSKTYGKGMAATRALREASLNIAKGEMVSITGPSGCGKTTLLHILAGIESCDSGEIWIGDAPLHEWEDARIAKLRLAKMGFVFQSYHLIPVRRSCLSARCRRSRNARRNSAATRKLGNGC